MTTAISEAAAKKHIKDYIARSGGGYASWYVGIAADVKRRLFSDHNVSEKFGQWAWAECETSDAAREVEQHFVDILGTKGGPGGGDRESKFVYAYKITSTTRE